MITMVLRRANASRANLRKIPRLPASSADSAGHVSAMMTRFPAQQPVWPALSEVWTWPRLPQQSQLPGEALKLNHMVLGGFAGVAHHAKSAGPDLAHLSHAQWAGGGSRYRAPRQLEAGQQPVRGFGSAGIGPGQDLGVDDHHGLAARQRIARPW